MEYDFSVLNDRDFEILANDLLSKHFGKKIERFKPGKDRGVDGRWYAAPNQEVVLQYKNWGKSGVEKLLGHLSSSELPKVKRLNPQKYVLATSVPLSRANKEKIKTMFDPFIGSESDIFGREDLHDILVKSPEVEARNPKLWVATARVLSQIFNNGLIGRSGFAIEEIQLFARRYVETSEADRARQMLCSSGVLIIKGEPGVGKTTLAHQMLLEALASGFSAYIIDSVEEAESVFDESSAQFFFFDDFLGATFLEAIKGREDARIVGLMRRVAAKENKRLVLTSRSHILEQGKDCSELFRIEKIAAREFELSVGHLTLIEKARILYSHIWAGGMPEEAIDALYEARRYLTVVKHRNFNPRLVAFITDADRVQGLIGDQYWEYVANSFDNPSGIWGHVFSRQLDEDTRDIAYLVGYNGRPISEESLKAAFRIYSRGQAESEAAFARRFHGALKLAVGSVVNRVVSADGKAAISLFNPSIADYLLAEGPALGILPSLFRAIRTLPAMNFMSSLVGRGMISDEERRSVLLANANELVAGEGLDEVGLEATAELIKSGATWGMLAPLCTNILRAVPDTVTASVESLLLVAATALESEDKSHFIRQADHLTFQPGDLMVSNDAIRSLCRIAKAADGVDGGSRFEKVSAEVIELWRENVRDFVADEMILADLYDRNEAWFAESQVQDFVCSQLDALGIVADEYVISEIVGEVDVLEVIAKNLESAAEDYWHDERRSDALAFSPDAEIEDYFERGS